MSINNFATVPKAKVRCYRNFARFKIPKTENVQKQGRETLNTRWKGTKSGAKNGKRGKGSNSRGRLFGRSVVILWTRVWGGRKRFPPATGYGAVVVR